jgi:hypothetical protein
LHLIHDRISDDYAKRLVISLCPLLGQIKLVRSYISFIADQFPYSFVDKRVLSALLSAVQVVHRIASLEIGYSTLPDEPRIVYSDDPQFRIELYSEIVDFAKFRLIQALSLSPLIMHSLLQDFLLVAQKFSEPGKVNVCFNLILKCLSDYNQIPTNYLKLIQFDTNFLSTSEQSASEFGDLSVIYLISVLLLVLII